MKSSGISSATPDRQPTAAAPSSQPDSARKAFALTGRSVVLDPRTHAVRGDLADVRLADQVFAPHYAAALPTVVTSQATLYGDRTRSEPIGEMKAGEAFEVLELAGDHAWGRAPATGLVGYVDRTLLDAAA
ncbi:SH3 domain-containing protein [Sphingomonas beigongshangi]|uniref:SH3 domain-containing protein n=1 Tax=Sphingomonas beigongshangi TaxID=2782540 RepID=UPI001FED50CA|nr:SH3 domain-containing protein [Sphingomonas beigongshangi]